MAYKSEMRQKQHDFYDKGAINKNTVTLGTLRSQSSSIFCEQRSGNKKRERTKEGLVGVLSTYESTLQQTDLYRKSTN